ncbi:exosortase V [Sphingobium fluviale]|uniref:Exosortase n=1 Tax=Sphingobium fluviale TaxID=2506423 RepID=A0A4Q1KJZ1_9SPHN|nr:exosortase V [Sphingobium fluviale]RXR29952.1 exosortase [Sphingobium fluviale]
MTASSAPAPEPASQPLWWRAALLRHWPLWAGFLILLVPTLGGLGREVWSMEIGAHGPIVLATGLWLITQCLPDMRARLAPASGPVVALILALALPIYAFGRAYDFISLEALGVYGAVLGLAYRLAGWPALRHNVFPFFYLGFLVPPPGWLIDQATAPLRTLVSTVATGLLEPLGYPILREGVTLFVGSYQLLVEDACAGMNSIVGLTAITLFYIYLLHRASWRYALLLVSLIIPVAIIVNILRVIALILLTHYYGDGVAQGFLHVTTGIMLFTVALAAMFGLDWLLQRLLGKRLGANA